MKTTQMKQYFFYLFLLVSLASCKTGKIHGQGTFKEGLFVGDNVFRSNLLLKNNQFYFFDTEMQLPFCCDTISEGSYQLDTTNKLLYLTSYRYIHASHLETEVIESKGVYADSVIFEINNPLESYVTSIPKSEPSVYYRIGIESNNTLLIFSGLKKYEKNKIVIYKPANAIIDSFKIYMLPNYNEFRLRSINFAETQTVYYKVKDTSSNYFKINIPDFTISYLAYRRLEKDIIRIVNANQLEWDGAKYFREK